MLSEYRGLNEAATQRAQQDPYYQQTLEDLNQPRSQRRHKPTKEFKMEWKAQQLQDHAARTGERIA